MSVNLSNYECEKYVCNKENVKETIEKYGVAIIPNVLDERECSSMVSGCWDFLEHISGEWEQPLNRNDTNSWREFYKLMPLHSMLIQHWGVGHAQVSWDLRQNIKIVEIFADLWGCSVNDLLVSFDGLSFHLPPEITKRGWNRNNTWYHTDQSFTSPDFKCVQSFVTGLDINEGDATLSFMEGSHKYHNEFKEKYSVTDKKNWYKLNTEEEQFYSDKGCVIKNIKCSKGSLVLWDSRTIHCGVECRKERKIANLRAVVYLCYMPRVLCSEKNLKKKEKALNELRTTSHYPCDIKLFGKSPRTYGAVMPVMRNVNKPILSELGKRLAGL